MITSISNYVHIINTTKNNFISKSLVPFVAPMIHLLVILAFRIITHHNCSCREDARIAS